MRKNIKTLRSMNPEAAEMWDYELNDSLINPDNIGYGSEKKAHFKCLKNSKHIFTKKICKMTSDRDGHNIGCIYCGPNAKIAFPGETDLLSVVPSARKLWDWNKNSLNPEEILPGSNKYAYFICEKKHSTYRKIQDFYYSPGCTECAKEKTTLIYNRPTTKIFWNKHKKLKSSLHAIVQSSSLMIPLSCPMCKYEWEQGAALWNERGYCPCCGYDGTEVSQEKNKANIANNPIITLRMKYPNIDEIWDYDSNQDITPDSITYKSNRKCKLKCSKGHLFERYAYAIGKPDGSLIECSECNKNYRTTIKNRNDIFTVCPEAKKMWNYNRNINLNPSILPKTSPLKVWFQCENGHDFEKKISAFTSNPVCPKCYFLENYSISKKRPDILKFWDYERMILNPDNVSQYCKENGYWKCPSCNYTWEQKITNRAKVNTGLCPSCQRSGDGNYNAVSNSFRQYNPEASKLWIDEMNNGYTPDNVSKKSGKYVYLRCKFNKKHIYGINVCKIPNTEPYGCKECLNKAKMIIPGENDFFTVCKAAKRMWNYSKNIEFDLKSINPKDSSKVSFTCNEGHDFERSIKGFITSQTCPTCKKLNHVVSKYPHLVKQWDFKKNKTYDINLISAYNSDKVWWKCKKCDYEWKAKISSRKASKGLCPCCENRTIVESGKTDLFTLVPELKCEFNLKKNKNININQLSVTSKDKIWWKCNKCMYEWNISPVSRIKKYKGNYKITVCPACNGHKRTTTYDIEFPDIAKKYILERNVRTMSELSSSDLKCNFWWHCDICGEDFEAALSSMIRSRNTRNKGCSYCASKKVNYMKSFGALHPELMDEYDPINSINPYYVTEKSNRNVKWICRNNSQHKWKATFSSRTKGEGNCNICRGYQYNKMFYQEHPEFEDYYDEEKNNRSFNSYSNMSNEFVWWKCKEGHSYQWPIYNYSRYGKFVCQVCNDNIIIPGINDFEKKEPLLSLEYDSEKNEISPNSISTKNSDETIWWKCSEGHSFQRSISYRIKKSRNCPICERSIVIKGINDFASAHKEILDIWDFDRNTVGPDEISDLKNDIFYYKCEYGHYYSALLSTVVSNNFECLICNGKIVQHGINSLIDTDYELSLEFSPNEVRKPEEFTKNFSYSILWRCKNCNNDYHHPINKRSLNDDSCPFCNNRYTKKGVNSLVDTHFELSKEYAVDNEYDVYRVNKSSRTWAYWNCPDCGERYGAYVNERELGDDSCPFCQNRKPLPGVNTFAVKHKDLMKNWIYINNYLLADPDNILDNCIIPVWWNCNHNPEHKYQMSPKRRLLFQKRNMEPCTICNGRRRKRRRFV